jgi:shikimate 5-dehydrogenase
MFVHKAAAAQAAGAVGVVVVNSEPALMAMGTDESGSQADIPAVLLPSRQGGVLLAALHGGGGGGGGGAGGSGVRLRLYAPREAAAAAERCEAAAGGGLPGGGGGEARAQQVQLLMSPQAQLWLFNRVAAGGSDPGATFARLLSQVQHHFQHHPPDSDGGPGGGDEGEGSDEDEYE